MKHRKFAVISTVVLLGMVGVATWALYTNYSAKASAPSLPDALNNLPSDCQVVFGINVQKFVASPAYAKLRQKQGQQIGSDLSDFIEKTGVDPARDVAYLVAAGRSKEKGKGEGVVIAVGRFNKDTITTYIRSKSTPVEMEYGGASILIVPDRAGDTAKKGMVFLSEREIALGDLESLKSVLDIRGGGNKSILLNPTMAPLINSVGPEEMFWFAADAAGVLASVPPTTTPLGANLSAVQNVVGILNISDAVTGTITATAVNADSAAKLADVARGFVALGQLAGDKDPDLKMLLGGLVVTQNATQIRIALNFPADLLDRLDRTRKLAEKVTGN